MSDKIERQLEIVARHIRGQNEQDWAAIYDTFVQDDRAHYDVVPMGALFKGIKPCADSTRTLRRHYQTSRSKSDLSTTFRVALFERSSSLAPTRVNSGASSLSETRFASRSLRSTRSTQQRKGSSRKRFTPIKRAFWSRWTGGIGQRHRSSIGWQYATESASPV